MSESARQKFETLFALDSAENGVELSAAEIREARGPDGEYSQYPYMHKCWIRFNVATPIQALAGDAQ